MCQRGNEQVDEEESNLGGCLWTGQARWVSAERARDLRPEELSWSPIRRLWQRGG